MATQLFNKAQREAIEAELEDIRSRKLGRDEIKGTVSLNFSTLFLGFMLFAFFSVLASVFFFNLNLSSIVYNLVGLAIQEDYALILNLGITGVAIIAIWMYFWSGVYKVPIAYQAVPLFLGTRIKYFILEEGYCWLPTFLMNMKGMDTHERRTDVNISNVVSSEGVRVLFDVTLVWNVLNPYRILSIDEDLMKKGICDVVDRALNREGEKWTAEQLVQGALMLGLDEKIEEATTLKAKEWGIKVSGAMITRKTTLNEKVITAWERETIEEAEKKAEEIEREHFVKSIDEISDNGKRMTHEMAAALFQTERGKTTPIRKIIVDGNQDHPLISAAALISDGMKKSD